LNKHTENKALTTTTATPTASSRISLVDELKALVKFKLSLTVLMSSMLAYLIVAAGSFSWTVFILLSVGGFLVTGAANALNQVLERDFDKLMERTKNRPLAAERMKISDAVLFAGFSAAIGIIMLALINPLTALLGTLSLISYAFVYTPLKRYSTISVAVGAIPGALPVLIGTVAGEGTITALGLGLFAIQFLWQFPHFWAIGWLSFQDYKKAGYKLLPMNEAGEIDRNLGFYSGIYATLMIPVFTTMYLLDSRISLSALIVSIILSCIYVFYCIQFQRKGDRKSARSLMFSSFFYLPLFLLTYILL